MSIDVVTRASSDLVLGLKQVAKSAATSKVAKMPPPAERLCRVRDMKEEVGGKAPLRGARKRGGQAAQGELLARIPTVGAAWSICAEKLRRATESSPGHTSKTPHAVQAGGLPVLPAAHPKHVALVAKL